MAKKPQKNIQRKENTKADNSSKTETESYNEGIASLIGVIIFGLIYWLWPSTETNPALEDLRADHKADIAIIEHNDCSFPGELGVTFHRVCGIIQNNGSKERSVGIRVDYYDSNNIKVADVLDLVKVDPNGGRSKFETNTTRTNYNSYKIKIDSVY